MSVEVSNSKDNKRIQTSVMFDPDVRRALRRCAAEDDTRISDIVNQAVRSFLGLTSKD